MQLNWHRTKYDYIQWKRKITGLTIEKIMVLSRLENGTHALTPALTSAAWTMLCVFAHSAIVEGRKQFGVNASQSKLGSKRNSLHNCFPSKRSLIDYRVFRMKNHPVGSPRLFCPKFREKRPMFWFWMFAHYGALPYQFYSNYSEMGKLKQSSSNGKIEKMFRWKETGGRQ